MIEAQPVASFLNLPLTNRANSKRSVSLDHATRSSSSVRTLLQVLLPLSIAAAMSSVLFFQQWQHSSQSVIRVNPLLLWSSPRPDGFNNQLISLYSAITCATHLGRTLVLPHMYENVRYDAKRQGPFPFTDYFNITRLAMVANITSPTNVLSQRYRVCRHIVYREKDVPFVLDYYKTALGIPLQHADAVASPNTESCIDDSLCNPAWDRQLGPYSAYNATGQGYDVKASPNFRRIRTALQPHRDVLSLAESWQAQMGTRYNAMHIRRGDYARKCASMKKECATFGPNAFFQSPIRLVNGVDQFDERLPLFVSTTHDEECSVIFNETGIVLWFANDFDVPEDLSWAKQRVDMLALASQVLASRAEQFMANRFSSFSSEVNHMRQLRNSSSVLMFF